MNLPTDELSFIDLDGRKIATALHTAPDTKIVLFCHAFISSKIGPNRFFVRLARRLQELGVCSLRFDQFGSGDSEGDFLESSFSDWIATTKALVGRYLDAGYQVGLVGQSMGRATVLAVAGDLGAAIASVVAWVPDPSVDQLQPGNEWIEEGGQRVRQQYWQEEHGADIVGRFQRITAPTLVYFATADALVSEENRRAIIEVQQPHQRIDLLEGWPHSAWTYDQATLVIEQTAMFLSNAFD